MSEIANQKIVLIESDVSFGSELSELLQKHGYAVTFVKEGAEGMKKIYDTLPHLVILDVALNGADSYDILAKKQAEPMLTKIPVFLLSTQVIPINMRRVPDGSVKEFLMALHIKPADVVDKVNSYFGHIDAATDSASPVVKDKLLWVEDDRLIGTILSKKLSSSGFDLMHAKNGEEALEMLTNTVPRAIVLDLVLPNMSGFEILQEIRKNSKLANVPVMILSNLSKQSDIERAKLLGAQKFLVKAAVSLDQIVEEVRGLNK